ncbi:gamma-glutamyl hydrolase-like, partial [Oratosquilla oratoria]|uniref:gamma-glutamyl hydrolase-like n=1 Tax=Oratosquilla oratoria TaxID=337810 RepID=UPI003F770AE4
PGSIPVTGILAQEPYYPPRKDLGNNYTSYIAASYVKFVESSGGRVAPIFINQDPEYYQTIVDSVNGILFPGGSISITNSSGYGMGVQLLYEAVVKKNLQGTYLPLWGTCLGFEAIMYLSAGMTNWLTICDSMNEAKPLGFEPGFRQSRLFTGVPGNILEALWQEKVTVNFHRWCMTRENLTASGLAEDFLLLTTNRDADGLEFVSTVEHNYLPFYGVQWHPEKNAFEWDTGHKYNNIPHSHTAIKVTQYFGNFFVNQARLNSQKFFSTEEEKAHLIYNYEPTDVSGFTGFNQVYLFS